VLSKWSFQKIKVTVVLRPGRASKQADVIPRGNKYFMHRPNIPHQRFILLPVIPSHQSPPTLPNQANVRFIVSHLVPYAPVIVYCVFKIYLGDSSVFNDFHHGCLLISITHKITVSKVHHHCLRFRIFQAQSQARSFPVHFRLWFLDQDPAQNWKTSVVVPW